MRKGIKILGLVVLIFLVFSFFNFVQSQGGPQPSQEPPECPKTTLFDIIPVPDSVSQLLCTIWNFITNPVENILDPILAAIFDVIGLVIYNLIFIITKALAFFVDLLASLNPFDDNGQPAAAEAWKIFRDLGILISIFSGLLAAFKYILGEEEEAFRLFFQIIIVSFFIFFSFAIIKEFYSVVDTIASGFIGGRKDVGSVIVAMAESLKIIEGGKEAAQSILSELTDIKLKQSISSFVANVLIGIPFALSFLILIFILAAIFFARYIFIVLLTAFSSFAIASTVIPKFRGRFAGITAGLAGFFDWWLVQLVNWIVIVPLIIFLIIMCLSFNKTFLDNMRNQSSQQTFAALFNLFLTALFVDSCGVVSILFAVKLSGTIGAVTYGTVMGGLALAGGVAAGWVARKAGGRIGGFLENAGGKLVEKAPLPSISKVGNLALQAGRALKEENLRPTVEMERVRLARFGERLEKAKTDEEREQIISKIAQNLDRYRDKPEILSEVIASDEFKNISGRDLLLTKQGFNFVTDPNLTEGVVRVIADKIKDLKPQDIQKILGDQQMLTSITQSHTRILNSFVDEVAKLEPANIIKALSQTEIRNIIAGLSQDSRLRQSINRATKGLFEAVIAENLEQIASSLAKLDPDIWKEDPGLVSGFLPPDISKQALRQAIRMNPEILKHAYISGVNKFGSVFQPIIDEIRQEGQLNEFLSNLPSQSRRALTSYLKSKEIEQQLSSQQSQQQV